jgi:hypothetical protein
VGENSCKRENKLATGGGIFALWTVGVFIVAWSSNKREKKKTRDVKID